MDHGCATEAGTSFAVERGLVNAGTGNITTGAITYITNNTVCHQAPRQGLTLEESLSFEELRDREHAIEDAQRGTCSWFTQTPQYRAWASPTRDEWRLGMLWLKGRPGAGKSTIVKAAIDSARKTSESDKELVLPHFFNARGSALQASTEGMYRTLLVWLLKGLPPQVSQDLERKYKGQVPIKWPVAELGRLFKDAVSMIGEQSVSFYIDALDECHKESVKGMLEIFHDVIRDAWTATPQRQIRVLFASRPYPFIFFRPVVYMDLHEQEGHTRDIARYIQAKLEIGEHHQASAIRRKILDKSLGVFLWVKWVVSALNDDFENGVADLQQRLHEIPDELRGLYRHTLRKHAGNLRQFIICLRWIIFCKDPRFNVDQLWWGVQVSLGRSDDEISREFKAQSNGDRQKYINSVSKGFAECVRLSTFSPFLGSIPAPYIGVQLVHESIRSFVLEENEFWRLCDAKDDKDFILQSFQILRDSCFAELIARQKQEFDFCQEHARPCGAHPADLGWESEHTSTVGSVRFPIAMYAVKMVFTHAGEAKSLGEDQTAFLVKFNQHIGIWHVAMRNRQVVQETGAMFQNLVAAFYKEKYRFMIYEGSLASHIIKTSELEAKVAKVRGLFSQSNQGVKGLSPASNSTLTQKGSFASGLLPKPWTLVSEAFLISQERGPEFEELLQDYRNRIALNTWAQADPIDCSQGPFLDLAHELPQCATFILLASTRSIRLEPYLGYLAHILKHSDNQRQNADQNHLQFLQTVLLFLVQGIPCTVVDFREARTRIWAHSLCYPDASMEHQICIEVIQQLIVGKGQSPHVEELIGEWFPYIPLSPLAVLENHPEASALLNLGRLLRHLEDNLQGVENWLTNMMVTLVAASVSQHDATAQRAAMDAMDQLEMPER